MKRIHEGWKRYLNEMEMKSDPHQSRLKVGEKMRDFLFSPLQIVDPSLDMSMRASGNVASTYNFLYWAVFGTKQERKENPGRIYRPKLGLEFAHQKVEMLMLKLTDDEERTLAADIDTIIEVVKTKQHPTSSVQIPVTLTGHPNVEPSFGTTFFGGSGAVDWGMGGSILTPDGKSYLIYILEKIKSQLPETDIEPLPPKDLTSLYFLGQPFVPAGPADGVEKGHFSSKAFDYEAFLKSIGRGGK